VSEKSIEKMISQLGIIRDIWKRKARIVEGLKQE
tara:strand:- start:50 stop:151 length:102 start_codon:yes stop_codon:yes gene_type:complete